MIPSLRSTWLAETLSRIPTRLATKFRLGQSKYNCDIGTWTDAALEQHLQEELDDAMLYLAEIQRRRELVNRQDAIDLAHLVVNNKQSEASRNLAISIIRSASLQ